MAEECRKEAELAFKKYDADGSGELGEDELKKVLKGELCAPLRSRTFATFVREIDRDGNGKVDIDEFCTGTRKRLTSMAFIRNGRDL